MNSTETNELTREELYEKVWGAPTVQVAAELGISDVALAKRCKKLNVPKPSLGYWAKVAAGQKPTKTPLPPTALEMFVQTAEKPLARPLSLPHTTTHLHPVAADLLQTLRAAKPSYDKRVWSGEAFSSVAKVGKDSIERTAKCFHVIVTSLECVEIPFSKPQGGRQPGCFRKGHERLYLVIEEEMVAAPAGKGRQSWHASDRPEVPSGKLTFSLSNSTYSSGKFKEWKEDGNVAVESLLTEIVIEVRKYFVAAVRRQEQEIIDRKRRVIEGEKRRLEYEKAEAVRRENERRQKHKEACETAAKTRAEDFIKAAEWWRLHRLTTEFINECEQRWRGDPPGELDPLQQKWIAWAQELSKAMSPLAIGYPEAVLDGSFDPASIPLGGPYPPTRDFPNPPTMPKIPPPVVRQNEYGSSPPEPPPPYPFWLKYQGR